MVDHPDSHGVLPCSVVLRNSLEENWILHTRLSRSMVCYSKQFSYPHFSHIGSPATPSQSEGLDCSAFARRYLRNHYCFLFLTLLRCFSSDGTPLTTILPAFARIFIVNYSDSIGVGFPIRKPSDYRVLTRSPTISPAYKCPSSAITT